MLRHLRHNLLSLALSVLVLKDANQLHLEDECSVEVQNLHTAVRVGGGKLCCDTGGLSTC